MRGGNGGQGGDCEERVGISGAMMVVTVAEPREDRGGPWPSQNFSA